MPEEGGVPGESIEDTAGRGRLKETHWRSEYGEGHPLV
jgi:hypothetical protein